MKQLLVLLSLLYIVSVEGVYYYCDTYPRTFPEKWTCPVALANGYIYTRSSTNFWRVCSSDGSTSSPTRNNLCPVPTGSPIPKLVTTTTVSGTDCQNVTGGGVESKKNCFVETTYQFPFDANTYPYSNVTVAVNNSYSYIKTGSSWFRIHFDLVVNRYITVALAAAPLVGTPGRIPQFSPVNIMSTHPCYSINTASEALAAGFRHYWRSGRWFHIWGTGSIARVTRDTIAPSSCTVTPAVQTFPSSVLCNECLGQILATTGECWRTSVASSVDVSCCVACDPVAQEVSYVAETRASTGGRL